MRLAGTPSWLARSQDAILANHDTILNGQAASLAGWDAILAGPDAILAGLDGDGKTKHKTNHQDKTNKNQ